MPFVCRTNFLFPSTTERPYLQIVEAVQSYTRRDFLAALYGCQEPLSVLGTLPLTTGGSSKFFMCELPPELYREILQHVPSKHDLCALSVTSRAFQAEAEFFIYQSIKSTRRLRTESICNLIIHCPRVRPLVHSLSISSEDYNRLGPLDYWRSVAQALENLPNLEVLRISDCMDKTNAWVFGRCTFQLTELDCDFDLDDAFISFLRGQRALKWLSWMYTHPGINAIDALPQDPQFLPSLRECITNSPSFAVKLMSCHSLTHVWVSGPCAYDQESWLAYIARFSDYTSALRSLRLNFPYNKRNLIPVLSALAKQAPELRSLGFLPSFTMQVGTL